MQAQTKHTCSLWIPSQLQPQMSKGLHWKWYRDKITNISEILKSQGHQVAPCPLKNRWLQRVQKPSCFPEEPQESSLSVRQQLAVCRVSHTQHLCLVLKSWRRAQITVIRADRGTRAMEAAHLWSQTLITSTPRTTSTLRLAGAMRHGAGMYLISTAPFPWDVAFFFPLTFLFIYFFSPHSTCRDSWYLCSRLACNWVMVSSSWSPYTCSALGSVFYWSFSSAVEQSFSRDRSVSLHKSLLQAEIACPTNDSVFH